MPGLGELRRVSAPRLICAGWRKTIAVSGNLRESDGVVRADIEVIQAVLASFSAVAFLKK